CKFPLISSITLNTAVSLLFCKSPSPCPQTLSFYKSGGQQFFPSGFHCLKLTYWHLVALPMFLPGESVVFLYLVLYTSYQRPTRLSVHNFHFFHSGNLTSCLSYQ